jgi:hypothetical protein
MIKRMEFATRRRDVTPATFAESWRDVVSGRAEAPRPVRPRRIAVNLALVDRAPGPKHSGVSVEWFDDRSHLERFEEWNATIATASARQAGTVVDPAANPVVLVSEVVLRGAEWLDERWRQGGTKLKHMAVARRAAHLTPAVFSQRWQERAGRVVRAGETGATAIPDEARGLAYVQNHPLHRAEGEWAYDAINEVYFDDEAGLRRRVRWFAENLGGAGEDDLVGDRSFLSASEEVLLDVPPSARPGPPGVP